MKKIEKLYAVMNEQNDSEAICGMGEVFHNMQCASSNKNVTVDAMGYLKRLYPEKKFWMAEFERIE